MFDDFWLNVENEQPCLVLTFVRGTREDCRAQTFVSLWGSGLTDTPSLYREISLTGKAFLEWRFRSWSRFFWFGCFCFCCVVLICMLQCGVALLLSMFMWVMIIFLLTLWEKQKLLLHTEQSLHAGHTIISSLDMFLSLRGKFCLH